MEVIASPIFFSERVCVDNLKKKKNSSEKGKKEKKLGKIQIN